MPSTVNTLLPPPQKKRGTKTRKNRPNKQKMIKIVEKGEIIVFEPRRKQDFVSL